MQTKHDRRHGAVSSTPIARIFMVGAVMATVAAGMAVPATADVTIVYPISGAVNPATDPPVGALRSAYITASFSVTCPGGVHTVKWGFDNNSVGGVTFYEQTSVQFVHKLAGGSHRFWVDAGDRCGSSQVKAVVGR